MHSIDWPFWFRVVELFSIAAGAFFVGRVYQFRKTRHLEFLNNVLMSQNLMHAYQQVTKHIDAAKKRNRLTEKDDAPKSH
jgi:hypothetical protein